MLKKVKNSVAVISGASRGIGKAIAEELAAHGYQLALMARDKAGLKVTMNNCQKKGAKTIVLPVDITNKIAVQKAIKTIMKIFNGIDILINNHGIYDHHFISSKTFSLMEKTINVNLTSSIYLTSQILPHMLNSKKRQSQRAIIFNASLAAKYAEAGSAAYCASKFGILGFAHALFEEVREHNIKVSAICAGYTNTSMKHDKILNESRMIQPIDIAKAVVFAISTPATMCPIELMVRPQQSPYI
ncbi:MAG TPA: SDR family oxidoreductase [Verrucomicrobiae bacterium]|nr:SDR family oxidoreductase [Verrucomicrobiae bacterium]